MDKIRNQCLAKMEEHYAKRIEKLIDEMRLEDAESLCQEMTFEGEEGEDCDLGSPGRAVSVPSPIVLEKTT